MTIAGYTWSARSFARHLRDDGIAERRGKIVIGLHCNATFVQREIERAMTWINVLPLWVLFAATVLIVLGAVEVGHRFALYRIRQATVRADAPIGLVVNSTLGLLAFMLAFTFGIAASRFDLRRELLLNEVNAIGTTYLRADLVTDPERSSIRKLLRDYVHLRAGAENKMETLPKLIARSERLQEELWAQATLVAKKDGHSQMHALFIESLNEMIDCHTQRFVVGQYQVPFAIWFCLYLIAFLSMAGVGYQFGHAGARDVAINLTLALSFSIVIGLIADLDRINEGTLQVNQRPMIDLDQKLSAQLP